MNIVPFDTAKFQEKLVEAKFEPQQAKAQSDVMVEALSSNMDKLATKEQMEAIKAQMEAFNMRFDDQKEFFTTKFNDQKEFLTQAIDTAITKGVIKLQNTIMYTSISVAVLILTFRTFFWK